MFAPLAPLAPRSCARLGDRSRLLRVPARLKSFPRKSDLELCAGRCKNQWNRLAGRKTRAAALEPSKAKRAKASPVAPSLGNDKPQPAPATAVCVKSEKPQVKSAPKAVVPEVEAPDPGEGSPKKGYIRTASSYIYNGARRASRASFSPGSGQGRSSLV